MRTAGGALVALLMLPTLGQAAVSRAQLDHLEQEVWRARADFHMYTVMDADPQYQTALSHSLAAAEARLALIKEAAADDDQQRLAAELAQRLDELRQATGADGAAVDRGSVAIAARLDAVSSAEAAALDDVQALASDIQRLAGDYVARAAAGARTRTSSDPQASVKAFQSALARARQAHHGDPAVRAALEQVALKWKFIRGSLLDEQTQPVPFLVYRYAGQISDTLTNLDTATAAR
ncbi:hypothetical protein [Alloalcanivorax mobilis]|uniref:hypothetical protein n=1 Tax=Alloalcanivorax mobilis TaxID=2019569 RepID=UPI0013000CA7|nr:hypothetical protein [Alloalcanivorax mobilis]